MENVVFEKDLTFTQLTPYFMFSPQSSSFIVSSLRVIALLHILVIAKDIPSIILTLAMLCPFSIYVN